MYVEMSCSDWGIWWVFMGELVPVQVGGGPSTNWKDAWWEDAFNSAAKGVNVGCSSSSSSDEDSSSDEEDGKVVGRKNRDGTLASASQQELKLLEELSKSTGRVAAGRFGGRDAKMERIRRQEALEAERLAAKLGLSTGKDEEETRAKKRSKSSVSETEEDKKKRRKKDKAGRIVIECGSDAKDGAQECLPEPTPRHGWWGCSLFISAGSLAGAALELPVEKKKPGFSEDQQAQIYNDAQKGKTSGKTGLGKGKRGTLKVDGVVWEGKKTTFDEDIESPEDLEKETGDTKNKKTKNGDVKWRKVIVKVLKKKKDTKPKGMKVTALHKNVRKMLTSTYSISMRKEEVREGVEKALRKNKGSFLWVGEYVKLST